MSQISQLLLYQEKDSELLKLEQEVSASEERKKFVQTQSFMKKASERLDQLDAKSNSLLTRLEALEQNYNEIAETLKDFEHLDELVEDGADVSFYQRNASKIAEKLKTLRAEINALIAAAKETTEEYQALKKKVIATQKQIPEIDAAYKAVKKTKQVAMDAISAELASLAASIDPEVLRKYQVKRSERIFPIICEIRNDRCSKCGIELSIADKDKTAGGSIVECENCHRFLYRKA
ncbi:MAG: zinc ribbon domain-containing protein [Candidatus Coproplasma sp.]